MINVAPNLYLGTSKDCRPGTAALSVVHACQQCFPPAGHDFGSIKLQSSHNLYLNLFDPDYPSYLFSLTHFKAFLKFSENIVENIGRPLLIHCQQARSRSPSLALLLLARRGIIGGSYLEAAQSFKEIYPPFNPNLGIKTFMARNWKQILAS